MLFNDLLFLEILVLTSVLFYISNNNIMMLLYTGGIYLILMGIFCLLNDADIYIGFLWVIDLGVGLIFFVFIVHFTSFLHQKAVFNISSRHFFFAATLLFLVGSFGYYWSTPTDGSYRSGLLKTWAFRVTYVDYYLQIFTHEVTDLNTLRDTYFLLNGFEFFIVNFSLFFGLVASILMCFMIHRIFNLLNFSQIMHSDVLKNSNSSFFIRSQNFVTQTNTSAVVRAWVKSKRKK